MAYHFAPYMLCSLRAAHLGAGLAVPLIAQAAVAVAHHKAAEEENYKH